MFYDYESHLAPEKARVTIAKSGKSYADGYIRWFFRVSHPYIVHASPGDPLRPTHQEILEKEQTRLDHTDDFLPRCRRIVEIVRADINEGIFPGGFNVRGVLDAIMTEAQMALLYQRHRWRTYGINGRGGKRGRRGI